MWRDPLFFQEYGHKAAFYHASMDPELRASVQEQWSKDGINIICATVAFGMGMMQFSVTSCMNNKGGKMDVLDNQ